MYGKFDLIKNARVEPRFEEKQSIPILGTFTLPKKCKAVSYTHLCDTPMVPGWKLGAMADIIFQKFWQDRNGIIEIANEMLEEHFKDDRDIDFQSEIEETQRKITIIDKKFDNLVDMRMAGEIDKAKFDEKKKSLFEEKEKWQKMLQSRCV